MHTGKGLALGLPSLSGTVCLEWGVAIGTIQWPLNMNRVVIVSKGHPDIAEAREKLAETAINQGCRYLFFLDDDVIVPGTCLLNLTKTLGNNNAPVGNVIAATGVYVGKCASNPPHIYTHPGEGCDWHWKPGDIFEVKQCGAGCLLIDLEMLQKVPKPWFAWTFEEKKTIGEDIHFCNQVYDAGFRILCDSNVLCQHYDAGTKTFHQVDQTTYPMGGNGEYRVPREYKQTDVNQGLSECPKLLTSTKLPLSADTTNSSSPTAETSTSPTESTTQQWSKSQQVSVTRSHQDSLTEASNPGSTPTASTTSGQAVKVAASTHTRVARGRAASQAVQAARSVKSNKGSK